MAVSQDVFDFEPSPPPVSPEPASSRPVPPAALRAGGPPLSSRAILAIGGLVLLCLALVTALAFVATAEAPTPALDAPVATEATPALPTEHARAAPPARTFNAEAALVADTTLIALEQAATAPIDDELAVLGAALQAAFGARSAELAPALRPYLAHAAGRMIVHPGSFALTVSAPDAALAAARADVLRRALEGAGLSADKVTVSVGAGLPAVVLSR